MRILAIGNSFSDDTMQYVYSILDDFGVENIFLGNLYIGGCTLKTHAYNAKNDLKAYEYRNNDDGAWGNRKGVSVKEALLSQTWDVITLQQASGSSGLIERYDDLPYLISYVKSYAPSAKIVWNMTWAYQRTSSHEEFVNYDNDQLKMYNAIVSAVKEKVVKNPEIQEIIACGTAIQNARTSLIGDNLTRDGYHLTYDVGRYIAGLMLASTLTGVSPDTVKYMPVGVNEKIRLIAVDAVKNAIEKPFEVTESAYRK